MKLNGEMSVEPSMADRTIVLKFVDEKGKYGEARLPGGGWVRSVIAR
jgi:transcriptional regulator CtsR